MPRHQPSLVIISPVLPHENMDNAGGNYLQTLQVTLGEVARLSFLVPDVPINQRSAAAPGHPATFHMLGRSRSRRLMSRAIYYSAYMCHRIFSAIDRSLPPFHFALALLADADARRLIREADLIDLQWSEFIRLAPLVRLMNRRARLIGTFHDVLSQRFTRSAAAHVPVKPAIAWRTSGRCAKRSEQAALRRLTTVVTLNTKDKELMGGDSACVRVVHPPLSDGLQLPRLRSSEPTIVFVANFGRDDNIDAAEWLLSEIWPRVRKVRSDAFLALIGRGIPDTVQHLAEGQAHVHFRGFVEDLASVYSQAWVAVVPLRLGAGVKFKTIEALVAGVPTVTTTVGAEGIGGPSLFAGLADRPELFAQHVIDTLADPVNADLKAAAIRSWAQATYSLGSFRQSIGEIYSLPISSRGASDAAGVQM